MQHKLDSSYLKSRAEQNYNSHDEIQMIVIVDKIVDDMKRRYGERLDLIKYTQLQKLVRHWRE